MSITAGEPVASYTGSHRVDVSGARVIVRDVDLFCAFDARFDDADNERISYFTNAVTRAIFEETRARMKRGQYPRLVLRHDRPGRVVEPEAIGRVSSIRCEDREGVTFLVGDFEMSSEDFEAYVLTDRYPRRSAEFDPATLRFLTNVALLGREAPARPLTDTRFAFESDDRGNLIRPLTPLAIRRAKHESGVGGGANAFIPGHGVRKTKASNTMSHTEDPLAAIRDAVENTNRNVQECMSRFSSMEARMSKLESRGEGEREDHEDEDEDKKEKADQESRRRATAKGRKVPAGFVPKSQFETERNDRLALQEEVAALNAKFRRMHAEKIVGEAIEQGYDFEAQRRIITERLAGLEESDQSAEFEVMKSIARRLPLDRSLGALHESIRSTGGSGSANAGGSRRMPSDAKEQRRIYDRAAKIFAAAEDAKAPITMEAATDKALAEFESEGARR